MLRRLVLGCSSVGHTLVERSSGRAGDLFVVTDDTGWITTLREENVSATEAAPTDTDAYPSDVDVVMIAGDDPERNLAAAERASERFPRAMFVGYTGDDPTPDQRAAMDELVDEVIDPVTSLADSVVAAAGPDTNERMARLFDVLRDLSGPLAVVAHDNPDPDAIASALGLARIAESVGVQAVACYGGEIAHQENRALVNLLDLPLRHLDNVDLDDYDGVALVDHSRPGINDSLPEETAIDVVVDHHPPRGPVEATYMDVRPDIGATSTQIAEYFQQLGIEPDRELATALLFGIRVDTQDFVREVSTADFEAGAELLVQADEDTLERVESPSVSPDTLDTLAEAIRNREVQGSAVASCVGPISDRDTLAQAAEKLLNLEDVTITLVYGYMGGVVYASARARGADVDVGEALREALGQIGSAGGHADMAGAQVPLGILGDVDEESQDTLRDIIEDIIAGRFFETLEEAPSPPTMAPTPDEFPTD
ncbi:MAG: DHH family phosphoesterase [Halopenitus sp.]